MSAGWSAQQRAEVLQRQARGGLWRRVLALLGLDLAGARTRAQAGRWEAGAVGEQRTAALLQPLAAEGWYGLYDRRIPGARRANADHVLIGPCGTVVLVDSKLWHARARVRAVGGRLLHGTEDRHRQIDGVLWEAGLIGRALRVTVVPVIVVHNAPVDGGGLEVGGVRVVPADRLVPVLRRLAGRPNPVAAGALALRADRALPRYVEGVGP